MSDNTTILSGNLTREPELRFTAAGQPVCNLGLAVNNRYQDRTTNQWTQKTMFMNVVVWGTMGENCAHSLAKGDRVTISGRLEQRAYERAGGDRVTVIDLVALDVAVSLRWATVGEILRNAHTSEQGELVATVPAGAPAPAEAEVEPI